MDNDLTKRGLDAQTLAQHTLVNEDHGVARRHHPEGWEVTEKTTGWRWWLWLFAPMIVGCLSVPALVFDQLVVAMWCFVICAGWSFWRLHNVNR